MNTKFGDTICPQCGSMKCINGKLDDGNNRIFYSAYLDIGNTKWSIWNTNQALPIDSHLDCCTDCGLVWLNTEATWVQDFIIRKCRKEFIEKIFKPFPIIKEYGIIDYQSVKINSDFNNDVNCVQCGSTKTIDGKFYIYLRFRKGLNLKRYSIFFDPGHIKSFIFLFRRGIQIRDEIKCCIKCGCIFSKIDTIKLKEYITKKCKDEFSKTLYGKIKG